MTDQWLDDLKQTIQETRNVEELFETTLKDFQEKLYATIEAELKYLRENGLENEFSEARRKKGEASGQELSYTAYKWELTYVPLAGAAFDENAHFPFLRKGWTAKILVFNKNEPDASPLYTYWIPQRGKFYCAGLAFADTGDINPNSLKQHVRLFLQILFTRVKDTWDDDENLTYGKLSKGRLQRLALVPESELAKKL
jgi:hypothetical protein